MNFAKGYEEITVRAVHINKDGVLELKEYSSSKELYDDVSNGRINLHQIEGNMFVIYGAHAEKNGEACTYQYSVDNENERITKKFYGSVVIACLDFKLGCLVDLSDAQLAALFKENSDKNCEHKPIKAVYRKPGTDPEVLNIDTEEDIYDLFGTDKLNFTKVGENLYAVSRSDAELDGEQMNIENWSFNGCRFVKEIIYGDVLIIGYISDIGWTCDLTEEQVIGIMTMFEDV